MKLPFVAVSALDLKWRLIEETELEAAFNLFKPCALRMTLLDFASATPEHEYASNAQKKTNAFVYNLVDILGRGVSLQ